MSAAREAALRWWAVAYSCQRCTHQPCPEQFSVHTATFPDSQAAPEKPTWHSHRPAVQSPRPWQLNAQVRTSGASTIVHSLSKKSGSALVDEAKDASMEGLSQFPSHIPGSPNLNYGQDTFRVPTPPFVYYDSAKTTGRLAAKSRSRGSAHRDR